MRASTRYLYKYQSLILLSTVIIISIAAAVAVAVAVAVVVVIIVRTKMKFNTIIEVLNKESFQNEIYENVVPTTKRQRTLILGILVFFVVFYEQISILRGFAHFIPQSRKSVDDSYVNNDNNEISRMTLSELTYTEKQQTQSIRCPTGQTWIDNIEKSTPTETEESTNDTTTNNTTTKRKRFIPLIVHQTSKTRCVSDLLYNITERWRNFPLNNTNDDRDNDDNWYYYFHDDTAMYKLLNSPSLLRDFPHLQYVANNCITSGTIPTDLWRYLILWEYGGIYADLDTVPSLDNFDPKTTIKYEDEAFFVIEVYGLLSQYFLASRPRHPLLWYVINDSLIHLLTMFDTGAAPAHVVTGPHSLHRAFKHHRADVGITDIQDEWSTGPIPVGDVFTGTDNTTITAVGNMSMADHIIIRDETVYRGGGNKKEMYEQMGMVHYHEQKFIAYTNLTCLQSIQRKHSKQNNNNNNITSKD